jgi:hypothetical protein
MGRLVDCARFFWRHLLLGCVGTNRAMRRKADKHKPVPAPDIENSGSTLKLAAPRAPFNEVEPALSAVRSHAGALLAAPPSSSTQSPASAGMAFIDDYVVVVNVVVCAAMSVYDSRCVAASATVHTSWPSSASALDTL